MLQFFILLTHQAICTIPTVTLSNNFSQLEEGLQRNFPTLVCVFLNFPCLLWLLIYTNHKYNKMKSWTDPRPHFLEEELIHCMDQTKNLNNSYPQKLNVEMFPSRSRDSAKNVGSTPNSKSIKIRSSISFIIDLLQ